MACVAPCCFSVIVWKNLWDETILTFPMVPSILQMRQQNSHLVCLCIHESEGCFDYHWQVQEEIHPNFNVRSWCLFTAVCLWNTETCGWWLGGSSGSLFVVGMTESMFYSLERWPEWMCCVFQTQLQKCSPKGINKLSIELVHVDTTWVWFSTAAVEKGPGVWQFESLLWALAMTDTLLWSIFHV